jgi:hypothetical protein
MPYRPVIAKIDTIHTRLFPLTCPGERLRTSRKAIIESAAYRKYERILAALWAGDRPLHASLLAPGAPGIFVAIYVASCGVYVINDSAI